MVCHLHSFEQKAQYILCRWNTEHPAEETATMHSKSKHCNTNIQVRTEEFRVPKEMKNRNIASLYCLCLRFQQKLIGPCTATVH